MKLSLPASTPGCGWNVRSSPAQWEGELKAIDWALAQLCSPDNKKNWGGSAFPDGETINKEQNRDGNLADGGEIKNEEDDECHQVTSSSIPDERMRIFDSIASRCTDEDRGRTSSIGDVSAVVSDFATLIGLYFTIWNRFAVNRVSLEQLLGSVESQIPQKVMKRKMLPRIGDRMLFKSGLYGQQVQVLRVSCVCCCVLVNRERKTERETEGLLSLIIVFR